MIATLVIIGALIPTQIHSDYNEALHNPLASLSDTPSVYEVKLAVSYIAVKYGLDETKLIRTLQCESGFRYNAKNPHSTASGVAQFIDSTWNNYCKGDKNSAKDQLICMAEFWQKGEMHQWVCYR